MRISDWSSDVCSSDLAGCVISACAVARQLRIAAPSNRGTFTTDSSGSTASSAWPFHPAKAADRKRGVSGKSVSVRVDLGGRRLINKKKMKNIRNTTNELHIVL